MIIIAENIGSLLTNIPKEVLTKLKISMTSTASLGDTLEIVVIYSNKQKAEEAVNNLKGKFEDLGYNFAIITVDTSKITQLAMESSIQYIEFPKSFYFSDYESNEAACIIKSRNTFNTEGRGVIIGFIDSGIDYTHPAFLDFNGDTRVKYIYDLSINEQKVYTENDINMALKNSDPYSIVPVYDTTGHGTHVAGIAAAGGNINIDYYGVAPKASIIMVKSSRGYYSLSTNIMRGIKFLVDKSVELNMPLVINMSLSTNDGAHDGKSILEKYVSTIADLNRLTIVAAAGNEGDTSNHIGGNLENNTNVRFEISKGEFNVVINLYKSILPIISINIITPTGKSTGSIEVKEGYTEGVVSGNKYQIYNSGPKPFDLTGEIGISLNNSGKEILSGLWTIEITILNEYRGIYDMWLPTAEGLNKSTKFLKPTISNTLGIPATVYNVISVGSYDYKTRGISSFSGRGIFDLKESNIKPDIVAPGQGIIGPIPDNSYDRKTGTSMATPHVSGACALMMEWGIVNGNDPYLYGERLKYYMIISSRRERRDLEYPNNSWGYGELCLYNSMENLIDSLGITLGNVYRNDRRIIDTNNYSNFDEYIKGVINNSNEIVDAAFEFSSVSQVNEINKIPGVSAILISNTYGIVYMPFNKLEEVRRNVKKLIFDEVESLLTLSETSPLQASEAISYQNGKLLDLRGKGVIIGIMDTGIDYLNKEFQNEDGTTRIISIWDQTLENIEPVVGLNIGREFNSNEINDAIRANNEGKDPYEVVASRDYNGHGTMVASVAAAKGYNKEVRGIAPDSYIAVVKLRPEGKDRLEVSGVTKENVLAFSEVSIISAMVYFVNINSREKKPIVIVIPLETNGGAHDGTSLICQVIDRYVDVLGNVIVTGVGNEGNKETHKEGRIEKAKDTDVIEIRVGNNQNSLAFFIWVKKPSVMAIEISSPTGERISKIPIKVGEERNIRFVFEKTLMSVKYILSNEKNGCQAILIRAIGLKPGIWKFTLHGEFIVDGEYSSWLPQSKLLCEGTNFLESSQSITLSDNATTRKGISVAYYDQNNNSIVGSSGRGFTWDNRIKPDIAAGGINAKITKPGGVTGTASGSSVSVAVLAGVCAMILEWAIVNGNNPNIYVDDILAYIIRGAKTRTGDEYPNEYWGYGMVNVDYIFEAIRGNYRALNGYKEYFVNNLFVRIPSS
ncbi:MAG: S8 family serine peptidase [Clostridiales bacterium]|nr:S8 family serine peptidase [Clostridiales bacterium]